MNEEEAIWTAEKCQQKIAEASGEAVVALQGQISAMETQIILLNQLIEEKDKIINLLGTALEDCQRRVT